MIKSRRLIHNSDSEDLDITLLHNMQHSAMQSSKFVLEKFCLRSETFFSLELIGSILNMLMFGEGVWEFIICYNFILFMWGMVLIC